MPATTDDRLLGGRYRLSEPLGRGGMGVVWAGRDEILGRDVAVKEIVPPLELPPEEREMLRRRTLREARAAARISSSAAVTVYDVVEEDGRPWIVMERLDARSLADIVREEGPVPPVRAAQLGLDVLDALEAAVSVGVLHRDVKPANVMVRSDGRAVLTDFGIASLEGDTTVTTSGIVLGSPAFMAPERARGERATLASDLWSLGATLYAAVDGRSPFERTGTLPTLSAVLHEPAPVLSHTGVLGEVIDALLAKEPAGRPTVAEVRTALQRIVSTPVPEMIPAQPTSFAPPPSDVPAEPAAKRSLLPLGEHTHVVRPPTRRRRVGRAVFGFLAVLTAAVVASFLLSDLRQDSNPPRTESPSGAQATSLSPTASAVSPRAQTPTSSPAAASPTPTVQATATQPPPTAPTQSDGAAALPAGVPAGFRLHTDPTGFTVAVPDGWPRTTEGPRTYFREPGGGRYLLVDQTTQPKDDPLTDWQANEPSVARRLSGYQRISLQRVDYRGWNTADWEFTYNGRSDRIHVVNRNIRVSDGRAYALYWSTPQTQWEDSRGMFDVIAATFQPAPG
jgi:eukaryotic-like serine/threonine-protein kinase